MEAAEEALLRPSAALAADAMAEVVIQVNGKVRDRLMLAAYLAEADARTQALAQPKIVEALGGRKPKKVIYVPGWLVSIVV